MRHHINYLVNDTWAFECTAAFFSLGCMVAIVVLLIQYNGQSQSTWNFPAGVTINAVIAVLNTAAKALMTLVLASALGQWKWMYFNRHSHPLTIFDAFDKATRGPLGSIMLLGRTRGWGWFSLGALLMIVNLASDPFTQQLITIQPATVLQETSSVRVPRAINYSLGLLDSPDFLMTAAIYAGLAARDPNDFLTLAADCPSANCIWPNFTSLGVCSACNDVTSEVHKITYNSTEEAYQDGLGSGSNISYPYLIFPQTILDPSDYPGERPPFDVMNITAPLDEMSPGTLQNISWNWLHIVTFYILNVTDVGSLGTWPNTSVSGTECNLSFCLQQIEDKIVNGTAYERFEQQPIELVTPIPDFRNHPGVSNIDMVDPSNKTETYTLSTTAINALQLYFRVKFLEGGRFITAHADGKLESFPSPQVELIYRSLNLEKLFGTLATSISFNMRQYSNGAPSIAGMAGFVENIVSVRWGWIVLPLFSTIFGIVFLVITARANHYARIPLWREGQLPVLMHGLDSTSLWSDTSRLTTCAAMGAEAATVSATLARTSGGGMVMRAAEPGESVGLRPLHLLRRGPRAPEDEATRRQRAQNEGIIMDRMRSTGLM